MRIPVALVITSLAVFVSGCIASGSTTPSSALDYQDTRSDALLEARRSEKLTRARWALPASSPFVAYAKLEPLRGLQDGVVKQSLPDVFRNRVVNTAVTAAEKLAKKGLEPRTLWIVDMRGAASVAFGATLNRRLPGLVTVVPVFKNQATLYEMVPARETLSALIHFTPHEQGGADAPVSVIVLDAWRRARPALENDGLVENRYSLSNDDLPSAEELKSLGIEQVYYLVEDNVEVDSMEHDVADKLTGYMQAGIRASKVDLDKLNGRVPASLQKPRI